MVKVTSKLQLTLPKAVATEHGIHPGDEVEVVSAGEAIRILPARAMRADDVATRLRLFDLATERQARRDREQAVAAEGEDRGWHREEFYTRGSAG